MREASGGAAAALSVTVKMYDRMYVYIASDDWL